MSCFQLAASERRLNRVNAAKVQMMKAALFDDEMAEEGDDNDNEDNDDSDDMEVTFNSRSMAAIKAAEAAAAAAAKQQQPAPAKSRPVILEARSTVLEKRSVDPLIEDIAHSVLTGGAGKGLGGSFSMDHASSAAAAAMSNNLLLRNRFLSTASAAMTPPKAAARAPKAGGGLPTYTLQAGYDKFVSLPNCPADDRPRAVVPRRTERPVAASESRFCGLTAAADSGLSAGRRFRAGWAGNWAFAHVGDAHDALADGGNRR